jgi:Leucine-rich repeat (LRR) protein
MKNTYIAILVVIVLALGGWLIYDRTKSYNTSSATYSNSGQSTSKANSTADVLDYSNKGLTSVGPDIYNQTAATTLILSNNNIKSLPSQMGKMIDLQVFKLDHNLMNGSLIAEVRLMPLVTLDVSYNNMTGMPAEIGQLNKLQTLNYSYNHITGLPNELANLKNNLKTFNLTGNPLSQSAISNLRAKLPNTNIIF